MRLAETADRAADGAVAPVAAEAVGVAAEVVRERGSYRSATSVCPRCYSTDVVRSRRQTVAVMVLRLVGVELLRCRMCGKRSWWF